MLEPRYKYEIALAGLLHDIGKFYQKTSKSSLYRKASSEHPLIAKNFVNKFRDVFAQAFSTEEIEMIAECATRHHSGTNFPESCQPEYADAVLKPYCGIIDTADNVSSSERGEKSGGQTKEKAVMHPILTTKEDLKEKQPVCTLGKFGNVSTRKVITYKETGNGGVAYFTDDEYLALITGFEKDFSGIKASTKEELFNKILVTIGNYTRCVPSACNVKVHDISLYQHLSTTSAIATAIYNDMCSFTSDEVFNISAARENKHEFSILTLRLDNAVEYLMTNVKTGLDSVEMIDAKNSSLTKEFDSLVEKMLQDMNLTNASKIIDFGYERNFIVPNGTLEQLKRILAELNDALIQKYHMELSLSYALSELTFTSENTMKSFYSNKTLDYVNGMVSYLTKDGKWNLDSFVSEEHFTKSCKCCGKLLTDEELCDNCKKETSFIRHFDTDFFVNKRLAVIAIDADKVIETFNKVLNEDDTTISRINTYTEYLAKFFSEYLPRELGTDAYVVNINANKVLVLCAQEMALDFVRSIRELFAMYTCEKLTLSIVVKTIDKKARFVNFDYDVKLRNLKEKGGNYIQYNDLILSQGTLDKYLLLFDLFVDSYSDKNKNSFKSILHRFKEYGLQYKHYIRSKKKSNEDLLCISHCSKDLVTYKENLNDKLLSYIRGSVKKIKEKPNERDLLFYMLSDIVYDVEVSLRERKEL